MGALCISPDCSVSLKLFQNTKNGKKKLEVFLMASMDKVTNIKKKKEQKKMKTVVYGRIRDHLPINFHK